MVVSNRIRLMYDDMETPRDERGVFFCIIIILFLGSRKVMYNEASHKKKYGQKMVRNYR